MDNQEENILDAPVKPEESSQVQNVTINSINPTPQPEVAKVPKKNIKIPLLVVGLLVPVLIFASIIVLWFLLNQRSNTNAPTTPVLTEKNSIEKRFVNCDDIRKVIEDDGRLYVSCLGGVLVADSRGKVVDQITQAEGLGNNVTTDLVKVGEELFIGTQDGITVYNLKTKKSQKISVKEGLVNGANIKLVLDGKDLWVGTFDGISKIDIRTKVITNFQKDFASIGSKASISGMIVTDKYFYALVLANAYSSGGVARYDKVSGEWKMFGVIDFGITGAYPRIDLFSIEKLGSRVYVGDNKDVWYIDEGASDSWQKIDLKSLIAEETKDQGYFSFRFGGTDSKYLYVLISRSSQNPNELPPSTIAKYNPTDQDLSLISISEQQKTLSYSNYINSDKTKIWFRGDGGGWLGNFNMPTSQVSTIALDRPHNFNGLLAYINNDLIVLSSPSTIWKYSFMDSQFTKLLDVGTGMGPDGTTYVFSPIPGSQNVFVFGQNCGMGCEEPKALIYKYQDGTSSRITLSDELTKEIKSESGAPESPNGVFTTYSQLIYKGVNATGDKYLFEYYQSESGLNYAVFDTSSLDWEVLGMTMPEGYSSTVSGAYCNPIYSFKTSVFSKVEDCSALATYSWEIAERKTLIEATEGYEKKTISLPSSPQKYSPFDWEDEQNVSKLMISGSDLWVGTNRGIVRYSPNTGETKLFSSTEGLIGNEVTDILLDDNGGIWTISNWAGMTFLPQN